MSLSLLKGFLVLYFAKSKTDKNEAVCKFDAIDELQDARNAHICMYACISLNEHCV